jgi:hypothetical protein
METHGTYHLFTSEETPNFYPSTLATNDTPIIRRRPAAAASTGETEMLGDRLDAALEELEILRRLKLSLTATLADLRKDLLFISTVAMMEQRAEDSILKQPGIKGNTPSSMIRYKAGSALNKIDQYLDIAYELQTPLGELDRHGEL